MYNKNYNDFLITPTTILTRWHLEDFVKVLDYNDVEVFNTSFWGTFAGFRVEFDVIRCALDCFKSNDSYFSYNLFNNTKCEFETYNISAADVVSRERMHPLASALAFVENVWYDKEEKSAITEFLDIRGTHSEYYSVYKYLHELFKQKLSDGSYLDKNRIQKVRKKLDYYEERHDGDDSATFYRADRSLLYDALQALDDTCVF